MEKYIIAGIKIGMTLRDGIIKTQAKDYLCDFDGEPEMKIGLSDEYIEQRHKENPHLSREECEYLWTGFQFCSELLKFDGFMLHSSAVAYENKAYLFSANSGTGKSTHTSIWQRVFGEDKAVIINDDKPAIKIEKDGSILVYGTPWSGKTDKNINVSVPLQGICFLERAPQNWIYPLNVQNAIHPILNQTIRPAYSGDMTQLLSLLDRLLQKTKVYRMGCNMEDDAAWTAYNGMKD